MLYSALATIFLGCCLQHVQPSARLHNMQKRSPSDLPVSYPGPIKSFGTGNIPESCRNQTFCFEKPADYPEQKFNAIMKGVVTKPDLQPTLMLEPDLGNRYGDPDAEDNCETDIKFDSLFLVQDLNGVMRTVIQAPRENYVQHVRIEVCKNEGATCFSDFSPPPDRIPFCKQGYGEWELVVSDGRDGTEKAKVKLPVCCSCHHKKISV